MSIAYGMAILIFIVVTVSSYPCDLPGQSQSDWKFMAEQ